MNQRLIYRLRNAYMWYKNLDKFMKYLNAADVGLNLFYSTPSCYLKTILYGPYAIQNILVFNFLY